MNPADSSCLQFWGVEERAAYARELVEQSLPDPNSILFRFLNVQKVEMEPLSLNAEVY